MRVDLHDKQSTRKIKILGHIIFLLTSSTFAYIFYEKHPEYPFHTIVYIGIAVNIWAALHGALDFSLHQADNVKPWFRGLNLVLLGTTVFLSLISMALKQLVLAHIIILNVALSLYLVWDIIAIYYYKKNSPLWYERYIYLLWMDLFFLTIFIAAYVPFLWKKASTAGGMQLGEASTIAWSDAIVAFALFGELFLYAFVSFILNKIRPKEPLYTVNEGYAIWANNYEIGNAIVNVERRHTLKRITEISITGGNIIDFGCGIGFYSQYLLTKASKVYAIDSNLAMLDKMKSRLGNKPNIEPIYGNSFALTKFAENSIDGIFCTLVIDHIENYELSYLLSYSFKILKCNGWLYITDVNPYFEFLEQPFAKFIANDGKQKRIEVRTHSIPQIINCLKNAGFNNIQVNEVDVCLEDARNWPELFDLAQKKFSLVLEYFSVK